MNEKELYKYLLKEFNTDRVEWRNISLMNYNIRRVLKKINHNNKILC